MRLLILIGCLAAALYYFRVQIGTTAGPALADVGGAIAQAGSSISWPGTAAKKALIVERDRSAVLEKAVASLSDKLARTATEKASSDETLQSVRGAAESDAASLQVERKRADTLAAQLATTRQATDAQTLKLGKQLADEQARSAEIAHDAATLRDRLAQAAADKATADATERDLHSAAESSTRTAEEEHQRADALAAQLASTKQQAASQVEALQKQLDGQKTVLATVAPDRTRAAVAASPSDADSAVPESYPLPETVPTRVVLRYSGDSPSARSHAMSLVQALQGQGARIVALVAAPAPIAENSVTYFYADDRGVAMHLTDVLPEFRSKLHRSTPVDTIPRPGVIEIAVAA